MLPNLLTSLYYILVHNPQYVDEFVRLCTSSSTINVFKCIFLERTAVESKFNLLQKPRRHLKWKEGAEMLQELDEMAVM